MSASQLLFRINGSVGEYNKLSTLLQYDREYIEKFLELTKHLTPEDTKALFSHVHTEYIQKNEHISKVYKVPEVNNDHLLPIVLEKFKMYVDSLGVFQLQIQGKTFKAYFDTFSAQSDFPNESKLSVRLTGILYVMVGDGRVALNFSHTALCSSLVNMAVCVHHIIKDCIKGTDTNLYRTWNNTSFVSYCEDAILGKCNPDAALIDLIQLHPFGGAKKFIVAFTSVLKQMYAIQSEIPISVISAVKMYHTLLSSLDNEPPLLQYADDEITIMGKDDDFIVHYDGDKYERVNKTNQGYKRYALGKRLMQ